MQISNFTCFQKDKWSFIIRIILIRATSAWTYWSKWNIRDSHSIDFPHLAISFGVVTVYCHLYCCISTLRGPAGRQMTPLPYAISQLPFNRSLPNCQQLLLMSNEGKFDNLFQLICIWVTIILPIRGKSWSKNKNKFCLIYLCIMLVTCYLVSWMYLLPDNHPFISTWQRWTLKLNFRKYLAIYTNYSWSNCTISN